MEKFENGTEVLIFEYIPGFKDQDIKHFIRGVILEGEKSENVALCGKPQYVINYIVLGEDGRKYFGNMKDHILGDYFFMTREMYYEYANARVMKNAEKIRTLNGENIEIRNIIMNLEKTEKLELAGKQV